MNYLDIQMFCKGMQSVNLTPKDFAVSLNELNEDIAQYYKDLNIHNFDALNKIMKLRFFGQGFLFTYVMTVFMLVLLNINTSNEGFLLFLISLISIPYIFSYFVLKK